MEFTTVDSSTLLGGLAVIISVAGTGFATWRAYQSDKRTAKKSEVDMLVDRYERQAIQATDKLEAAQIIMEDQAQVIRTLRDELAEAHREIKARDDRIKILTNKLIRYEKVPVQQ